MANYRGFFCSLKGIQYRVDIIENVQSSVYTEIPLAAGNPFTVNYNASNTPFDPIRTSTASINIVYDKYLADCLSSCAQGTIVELWDITTNYNTHLVWTGYLLSKVYEAGYTSCYESFSLEAADCLSSLQYVDYEFMNDGGIVNVKDVIAQCCDKMGLVDGFYWTRSKRVSGTVLLPEHMVISEHNFVANDVDEKWKCQAILEELCRYLGFTCMQIGTSIYFIDYQYLEPNERLYVNFYSKSTDYSQGGPRYLDSATTITQSCIMGADHSISFEGIYNHISVKDNLYAAENIFPSPFDDQYMVNRFTSARTDEDGFYKSVEVKAVEPNLATYPNGTEFFVQRYKKEEASDSGYTFMHRLYDNDYWESLYYTSGGTQVYLSDAQKADTGITREYLGGTLVDMGVARKMYVNDAWLKIIPSKIDYTRYLCISTKHNNDLSSQYGNRDKVVFRLKPGFVPQVLLDENSFLVLDFTCLVERYWDRNYINPQWVNTKCKHFEPIAGNYYNSMVEPRFRLHIGNKGWSSYLKEWVDAGDVRYDILHPEPLWETNDKDYWNKDFTVNNTVPWQDEVNMDGYKIPLSGVDITEGIEFEVLCPGPLFYGDTGGDNPYKRYYEWNSYMWLKSLSMKCVQKGQDAEGNESDVVYDNEPATGCSINDLEMTCRITTHRDNIKPSYSHMGYKRLNSDPTTFLTGITETAISNVNQAPEENIIEKYVHQYSTPTKKITLDIDMEHTPLQKTYNVDVENPSKGYVQLGAEIDYKHDRQQITFVEKTK